MAALTKDEFVADLQSLLSDEAAKGYVPAWNGRNSAESESDLIPEARSVTEGVVVSAVAPGEVMEASGADLEKKARAKRKDKTKHLGAGRNPFKHKDKLGLGPRGHHHNKTGAWHCNCGKKYSCVCHNGNRTKTIRIGKAYKRRYNAEYKRFRKHQVY